MKKRTKKQYAEEKQAVYKTGGGQYKAISDPIAEQVRELIRPSVEGLSNTFDNDCSLEFENNFNRSAEFVEEWLDTAIEDSTEGNEGGREEDDNDKEEYEDDRKDDDESDIEKDNTEKHEVLKFLQKDKLNWKNWNPKKLQTEISIPLKTPVNKKRSAVSVDESITNCNQSKKSKENNFVPSAPKVTAKKTNYPLKEKNNKSNNKLEKFGLLAESKIELVNTTMDNGKEKHEFEINILKTQLQKEQLQVEIMQKELELKTLILDREQRRFKNMS